MARGSVLIVEDDWVMARAMEQTLKGAGFSVVTVPHPDEARVALDERSPDLLLMDISLGNGADGITFMEGVQRERALRFLYVSGWSDTKTLERARDTRPTGYVVKPFTPEQLLAAVEMAMGAPRKGETSEANTEVHRQLRSAHKALDQITQALGDYGIQLGPAAPILDVERHPRLKKLSERETEVLQLLVSHRRPKGIAKELDISPHTVRNHLKSIFNKLGVRSQEELLELLVEQR